MQTKQQYEQQVSGHGKFECEPAWTPYFWDLVMDGMGESEYDDYAEEDGCDVVLYYKFIIDGNDIELFPELKEYRGHELQIWEDSQGFVVSRIL